MEKIYRYGPVTIKVDEKNIRVEHPTDEVIAIEMGKGNVILNNSEFIPAGRELFINYLESNEPPIIAFLANKVLYIPMKSPNSPVKTYESGRKFVFSNFKPEAKQYIADISVDYEKSICECTFNKPLSFYIEDFEGTKEAPRFYGRVVEEVKDIRFWENGTVTVMPVLYYADFELMSAEVEDPEDWELLEKIARCHDGDFDDGDCEDLYEALGDVSINASGIIISKFVKPLIFKEQLMEILVDICPAFSVI